MIVGVAAVVTVTSPKAVSAKQRQVATVPATATLPAVLVIGKRETRVAATEAPAGPSLVQ